MRLSNQSRDKTAAYSQRQLPEAKYLAGRAGWGILHRFPSYFFIGTIFPPPHLAPQAAAFSRPFVIPGRIIRPAGLICARSIYALGRRRLSPFFSACGCRNARARELEGISARFMTAREPYRRRQYLTETMIPSSGCCCCLCCLPRFIVLRRGAKIRFRGDVHGVFRGFFVSEGRE